MNLNELKTKWRYNRKALTKAERRTLYKLNRRQRRDVKITMNVVLWDGTTIDVSKG